MTGQLNWQQIIYILPYSPTAWDAERFGFEYLKKQNIGLRIFDISPLVSTRQDAGSQFLDNDNIIKIN